MTNNGYAGGLEGKSAEWMNDEELLDTFTNNKDGAWSMCLEWDSDPLQGGAQCLWMDAGYMSRHSRFIEGFVQNLNLNHLNSGDDISPADSLTTSSQLQVPLSHHPIVVRMPRVFIQRCSLQDVRCALACLYFPDRFPVKYQNLKQVAAVADFFDIPILSRHCDEALLEHIKRKINNNGASIRFLWFGEKEWDNLVECMLLADRFKFTASWSRLKLSVLRSLEDIGQLIDHENFKKLSAASRLDLLDGCVRKHMMYLRHNWK